MTTSVTFAPQEKSETEKAEANKKRSYGLTTSVTFAPQEKSETEKAEANKKRRDKEKVPIGSHLYGLAHHRRPPPNTGAFTTDVLPSLEEKAQEERLRQRAKTERGASRPPTNYTTPTRAHHVLLSPRPPPPTHPPS